jgi:hypothetical protein
VYAFNDKFLLSPPSSRYSRISVIAYDPLEFDEALEKVKIV